MFRIPYRWTWRTAWGNICWAVDDVWCGIKNVVRWTPVIWYDGDFDWNYLTSVMEYKFRRMARYFEKYGHHVNSRKEARQLLICAELCRRLNNRGHNYYDMAEARFQDKNTAWAKRVSYLQMQDQELLGRMIGKWLRWWWD